MTTCSINHLSALQDINAICLQPGKNIIHFILNEETQITTAGLNSLGLGLKFLARLMEIDLLISEFQGVSFGPLGGEGCM